MPFKVAEEFSEFLIPDWKVRFGDRGVAGTDLDLEELLDEAAEGIKDFLTCKIQRVEKMSGYVFKNISERTLS